MLPVDKIHAAYMSCLIAIMQITYLLVCSENIATDVIYFNNLIR